MDTAEWDRCRVIIFKTHKLAFIGTLVPFPSLSLPDMLAWKKTAKLITFSLFQRWQIMAITLVTAPTAAKNQQCITVFRRRCYTKNQWQVGVANKSNSALLLRIIDTQKEKMWNKRLQLTQFAPSSQRVLSTATTDWRPIKALQRSGTRRQTVAKQINGRELRESEKESRHAAVSGNVGETAMTVITVDRFRRRVEWCRMADYDYQCQVGQVRFP